MAAGSDGRSGWKTWQQAITQALPSVWISGAGGEIQSLAQIEHAIAERGQHWRPVSRRRIGSARRGRAQGVNVSSAVGIAALADIVRLSSEGNCIHLNKVGAVDRIKADGFPGLGEIEVGVKIRIGVLTGVFVRPDDQK